jgi:hypothetical protein
MQARSPTSHSGFACPKCGCASRIIDSRAASFGAWRRRRECVSCDYRFSTLEAIALPKGSSRSYPARRVVDDPGYFADQHRERWEREHPR